MHHTATQPSSFYRREEDSSSSTQSSTPSSTRHPNQASNHSSAPPPYSPAIPTRKTTINETTTVDSTSLTLSNLDSPNDPTKPQTTTTSPAKHNDAPIGKCKCQCTLCIHMQEWKDYRYDINLLLKFATKFLIKTSLPLAIPMIGKAEQKLQSEEGNFSPSRLHVLEKLPLRCVADYYSHKHERERMAKVDMYVLRDLQVKNPKLAKRVLRLAREEYIDMWEERAGLESGGGRGCDWGDN